MSLKDFLFTEAELENEEFQKDDQRERLIYNVTEDILVLMNALGVSKTDLAERMNTSKSNVSQLLDGGRNMTLGTFSDMCFALGVCPSINIPGVPVQKHFT